MKALTVQRNRQYLSVVTTSSILTVTSGFFRAKKTESSSASLSSSSDGESVSGPCVMRIRCRVKVKRTFSWQINGREEEVPDLRFTPVSVSRVYRSVKVPDTDGHRISITKWSVVERSQGFRYSGSELDWKGPFASGNERSKLTIISTAKCSRIQRGCGRFAFSAT